MVGVTQRLREVEENMRERVSCRVADYSSEGKMLGYEGIVYALVYLCHSLGWLRRT